MKRFAICLIMLLAVARAARAGSPTTITITCATATVAVVSVDTDASSIQITAPSTNTGTTRIGDATTSSTVGELLGAGAGQYFPPRWQGSYNLKNFFVYCTTGDKITVIWVDNQ